MTLQQAMKQWGMKESRLLNILSEGVIPDIRVEDNMIVLPDIPKPFTVPGNAKRCDENIYKYILSAVSSRCYLNAGLFGKNFRLSDSDFKDYIEELERCGMLRRKNTYDNSFSTVGFFIAADKRDDVNKIINSSKVLSVIKALIPDINLNIGCVIV